MLVVVFFLCIVTVFNVQVHSQYTNSSSSTTLHTTSPSADLASSSTSSPFYSISYSDEFLSIYTWSSVLTVGTFRTTEVETEAAYRDVYAKSQNGTWGPTSTATFASQIFDAAYSSSAASKSRVEASRSSARDILSASCVSAANAYSASNATNGGSYSPPATCCYPIEPCSIYADQVEIIYFANGTVNSTANLTYSEASTFVSNAYTFTSPSIYVVYSTLLAIQGNDFTCYGGGTTSVASQGQQLGANYTGVTRAYAPGVIQSGHCYHGGIGANQPFDPADLATPLPNSIVVELPDCVNGKSFGYAGNGTELWASPQIALPTDVAQIDPLWSTCHGFAYGAWDPPIALTPARALIPSTTDPGTHQTQNPPPAQPQSQASTPVVGPTSDPPSPTQKPTTGQPSTGNPPSTIKSVDPPVQVSISKPSDPSVNAGNSGATAGNSAGGQFSQDLGAVGSQPVKSPADQASSPQSAGGAAGNASPVQDPGAQASSQGQPAGVVGPVVSSLQPAPQKSAGQAPPAGQSASGPANAVPNAAQTQNGQGSPVTQGAGKAAGNSALPAAQSSGGQADPASNAGGFVIPLPASSQNGSPGLPSVGGQQITAQSGGIVAGGKTILPGSVATVGGQQVSVGAGVVAVGSTTYALPGPSAGIPQVAGQIFKTVANGGVLIAGTTLSAGGAAATIQGSVISVLPSGSGLLVNSQAQPTAFNVAGQQVQTVPNGAVVIGDITLSAGGAAVTIQGNTISVFPGGSSLLVNGQTQTAPSNIGGQQIKTLSNPPVVIGSVTISAGGSAVTLQGSVVSVLPSGSGLLVNGQTQTFPVLGASQGVQPLTVAGQEVKKAPSGAVVIGSMTLSAGGSAATVQGSTISVLPGGSSLLVNGQTQTIPSNTGGQQVQPLTIAGQQITTAPSGAVVIGSITLSVGGPAAIIQGTTISVLPGGSSLLVNGQTQALPKAQSPQSIFTVGGQTFTANPTAFSIDGTTLKQGQGAVTISGTVVSLGPSGLRIGSSTVPLSATTSALGSIITGAFGTETAGGSGGVAATATATATGPGVLTFQGRGMTLRMDGWVWLMGLFGWIVVPGLVIWL